MNFFRNVLIISVFLVFAFLLISNVNKNLNAKHANDVFLAKSVQSDTFTNEITFQPPLNCRVYDNLADFDSDKLGDFKSASKGVLSKDSKFSVTSDSKKCVYFWCDAGDNNSLFCFNGLEYSTSITKDNSGRVCIDPTANPDFLGQDKRFDYFWWDGNGIPPFPENYPATTDVKHSGSDYSFSQDILGLSTPTGRTCQTAVREFKPELNDFELYPNPLVKSSVNSFNVKLPSGYTSGTYNLWIDTIDGKTVFRALGTERMLNIPIGSLPTGNYFVLLNYRNTRLVKPLVIMK